MKRSTTKRYLLLAVVILLVAGGAFGLYYMHSSAEFVDDYANYAAVSAAHTEAAHLPAANNNPLRQELNRTLGEALAGEVTNSQRLALAKRGLLLLEELETQIDDIGEKGIVVDAAIATLEADGVLPGSSMSDIIELAKERSRIIADIRGLSYRANYHTAEILNRIIEDNGALTDEHVLALNKQIPKVEEQFDKRTYLYDELQTTSQKIATTFASMSEE